MKIIKTLHKNGVEFKIYEASDKDMKDWALSKYYLKVDGDDEWDADNLDEINDHIKYFFTDPDLDECKLTESTKSFESDLPENMRAKTDESKTLNEQLDYDRIGELRTELANDADELASDIRFTEVSQLIQSAVSAIDEVFFEDDEVAKVDAEPDDSDIVDDESDDSDEDPEDEFGEW